MSDWMALWTRMNTLSESHSCTARTNVSSSVAPSGARALQKSLKFSASQRFSFCKFCKPVKALAHPHEDGFEQAKFVWVISKLQVGGVEINNINVFNFLNTCVV